MHGRSEVWEWPIRGREGQGLEDDSQSAMSGGRDIVTSNVLLRPGVLMATCI
jgi:hypothetical protein